MTQARWEHMLLAAILVVAAVLRFYGLGEYSLTNDELSAIYRLDQPDLASLWKVGVMQFDFHPAGVQTFLWYWTKMFGTGTWIVRLPFAVCGLASVWLTFVIGKRWANPTVGLIAAAFLACLAFPVLYSRLARPYAPGLFFTLGALWYWSSLVLPKEQGTKWSDVLGFAVLGALCAYTHYYCALSVGMIGVSGLLLVRRNALVKYASSGLIMLLLFAPHWSITSAHLAVGGVGGSEGWLDPPTGNWLFEHFEYVFNTIWIPVLLLVVGIILRVFGEKLKWNISIMGVVWYALLLAFGYFYSHQVNPIFQNSTMLFAFPSLLIALCWWATPAVQPKLALMAPLLVLVFGTASTLAFADPFGKEQFGEFKAIATAIDEWNEEKGSQNIASAYAFNNNDYLQHYLNDTISTDIPTVQQKEQIPELMRHLAHANTPYFVYAWSTTTVPFEAYPLIRCYYPFVVDDREYFNSRATLFSKEKGETAEVPRTYSYAREGERWIEEASTPVPFKIAEQNEFFGNIELRALDLSKGTDSRPYITLQMELDSVPADLDLVLVFEWHSGEEQYRWRGSSLELFPEEVNGHRVLILTDQLPKYVRSTDIFKAYCWNKSKDAFEVERLQLSVHRDR